jgi:hypothetical protein
MSPIRITSNSTMAAGATTENPWVGPIDHTVGIIVDLAALTNKEIDTYGYLKPGVPLNAAGGLVTSGAVYGVTIESIKVLADNAAGTISAAGEVEIGVGLIGTVNRDIIEDNLERALTAAELAGFAAAGSTIRLL